MHSRSSSSEGHPHIPGSPETAQGGAAEAHAQIGEMMDNQDVTRKQRIKALIQLLVILTVMVFVAFYFGRLRFLRPLRALVTFKR